MSTETEQYTPTERTQVRRLKKRASYDKQLVHSVLDEGLIAHVGFCVSARPYVIPTIYARDGEQLYMHGSIASRMLKTLEAGVDVCATVSLIDSLVLARSAFHHSMNYRSVVVLGKARLVSDRDERLHALEVITDHIVPGRWSEVRAPNALELKQTTVLALPLQEVSAKVRDAGAIDDEEDYTLPIWAGVIPLLTRLGTPQPDARLHPGAPSFELTRFKNRE